MRQMTASPSTTTGTGLRRCCSTSCSGPSDARMVAGRSATPVRGATDPEEAEAGSPPRGGEADGDGTATRTTRPRLAFAEHVGADAGHGAGELGLGRRPPELSARSSRALAVAGPGVIALRALARICGGVQRARRCDVRTAAARIAWAFRNLFNAPEPMAIVRGVKEQDAIARVPYWRQVLHYSIEGCLQAVLDEYLHIVRESQGLVDEAPLDVAEAVAGVLTEALSLRTASLRTDSPQSIARATRVTMERRRMRAHYALRFGDERAETGQTLTRAASVREAFNSPFWPFVVATTSMGQEGLDFHCYCHAVVHWNLPSNPVDLEQREGRVHRYKGHAVRKNVALRYGLGGALARRRERPVVRPVGAALRARAHRPRPRRDRPRPVLGVSRRRAARASSATCRRCRSAAISARLEALLRSLVVYRAAIGQPRQQDLVEYLLSAPARRRGRGGRRRTADRSDPAQCRCSDTHESTEGEPMKGLPPGPIEPLDLAVACCLYKEMTSYARSLDRLREAVGPTLDLRSDDHRAALLQFLNDWGCRNLAKAWHERASHALEVWFSGSRAWLDLLPDDIGDFDSVRLGEVARAFDLLSDANAAEKTRQGVDLQVSFGPTATSKSLFALRPNMLPAWDGPMRKAFGYDERWGGICPLRWGRARKSPRPTCVSRSGDLSSPACQRNWDDRRTRRWRSSSSSTTGSRLPGACRCRAARCFVSGSRGVTRPDSSALGDRVSAPAGQTVSGVHRVIRSAGRCGRRTRAATRARRGASTPLRSRPPTTSASRAPPRRRRGAFRPPPSSLPPC